MDHQSLQNLVNIVDDSDESWFFMNNVFPNIISSNSSSSSSTQNGDNKSSISGMEYITDILNKTEFRALCGVILAKGIVNTNAVAIEEQVGMFLNIVGHGSNMKTVSLNFKRSIDTVNRTFNDVLWSIIEMKNDYIKLPGADAPRHACVGEDMNCFPFKDALGAIGGTHIPAFVEKSKRRVHTNKKGFVSQNVMAAVDFDMKFVYVSVGWEGSASDMKVLNSALEEGGFTVPPNRYYLANSSYANSSEFICPYRGRIYHFAQFQQLLPASNRYREPKDLFNYRHAQLRNVVERTFGALKMRFKILRIMQPFRYRKQCLIVLACCILHNFIERQNEIEIENDLFLDAEQEIVEQAGLNKTQLGELLRTGVRNALWVNMQKPQ